MDCALSLLERLVMLMETQDKKVEFGKHIVNYTVANNWMFRGFESSEAQRTAKKIEEKEFYNNHILKTNKMLEVKVKLLTTDGKVPTQSKAGDAGFDLVATSKSWDKEGNFMEYGTGIAVEIPVGHAGLIFPRSSVSKTDLIQANCVGVVDAGYRGEVKVRFKVVRHVNLSRIEDASLHGAPEVKDFQIGDRIAQLVIMPIPEVAYTVVAELSNSDRGEGGFGHTGQ
jgi:dUTP pyrophosphatase